MNRTVERTADILELIAGSGKPLRLSEISRRLSLPKSSAFDLLHALTEKGLLEIADKEVMSFRIGLKLFVLGSTCIGSGSLVQTARPYLEKILEEAGETVFFAVENRGELVYLDKLEPANLTMTPASRPGSTNPLTCTGIGKAILAACSDEEVKGMLAGREFVKKTERSVGSLDELLIELKRIRNRGYALDNRESEEEIACVALPVYNETGKPVAAVSISGLAYKMDSGREQFFYGILRKYVPQISARLGCLKEVLY